MGLVWIDFPNLSKKDPSLGKLGHVIKDKVTMSSCSFEKLSCHVIQSLDTNSTINLENMEPYIVYFRAQAKCFLPPVWNVMKMKKKKNNLHLKPL